MATYDFANYENHFAEFQQAYPQFDAPELERLRAAEYSRLDRLGQIYLDYTGGGLYADSQLEQHMAMLRGGVYGNPHSSNPTSLAATQLDEQARAYVLDYFNASPNEYAVVFTANASGALRLVGESYPFEAGGHYLLTFDNHNSVNGIREFARKKGAAVTYTPVLPPDLRLDEAALRQNLALANPDHHNLFAYPAQSNFSGVQHSLKWIAAAQAQGWDVLLDAAAFVPTNRLDLSRWKPDFVSLSFYKIFGYPTGVGALVARRDKLLKLRRPWFAGGTITIASVQGDTHYLVEGEAAFEDGTIDYLNLPAVEMGLKHIQKVGIERVHDRVIALTDWLLKGLTALKHNNERPLARIYGPVTSEGRGGTISVNFFDPNGRLFDYKKVEALASERHISLRKGCFCNPGAGEIAHHISKEAILACLKDHDRMDFNEFVIAMSKTNDGDVGAVRVSVGIATNFADVYAFMNFAETFLNKQVEEFL